MTTPAELDCLSLMELLDIAQGSVDSDGRAHLAHCPRCRALLAMIPETMEELPSPTSSMQATTGVSRDAPTATPGTVAMQTGAVWRALATPADDFAWVVVIIGRAPDAEDRFLVAPVIGPPATATEQDLLLDPQLLGYPAFADVSNAGVLVRDQLIEELGSVTKAAAEALVALHRSVLADAAAPDPDLVGVAVVDELDPRLLDAEQRRRSLRALWRAADQLVDQDEASLPGPAASPEHEVDGLAATLAGFLDGPDASWDRETLLETSGADGAHLDAFLQDHLQLTDMTDVSDLARVMHTLEIDWDKNERVVAATLARSAGGIRRASGESLPMAARARPGANQQDITKSLYADQTVIDASDHARAQQIPHYLAELRRALDELE